MKRFFCWLDRESGRYVLQGKELHCGDCFQVRVNSVNGVIGADGPWLDVRIEMSGRKWYIYGVPAGHSTEPDAYEARLYPGEAR
jgi:hypothetical protein